MQEIKVIELFAGVGGFRLGLEGYNGKSSTSNYIENINTPYKIVWSNQWEPSTKTQHASMVYENRFGDSVHSNMDINLVDINEIPEHDLMVGGFPCFVAGTMVLTDEGYKPIEEINVGDMIYTKELRYRKCTSVMSRDVSKIYDIKYQGGNIKCSDEHPIFSRMKKRYKKDIPDFIPAKELNNKYEICFPIINGKNEKIEIDNIIIDEKFGYFIGRFLGDGWVLDGKRKNRKNSYVHKIVVCTSKENNALNDKLLECLENLNYNYTKSINKKTIKYIICSNELEIFFKKFGRYSYGKRIPGFIFSLPNNIKEKIIEGYKDSDGYILENNHWSITSINYILLLGISQLIRDCYGCKCSINGPYKTNRDCIIEGRLVNEKPQYKLNFLPKKTENIDYVWSSIKKIKILEGNYTVYNISVDEDETYTANGIIVHNCQDYSVASTSNNSKGIEGKKGVLWWSIYRILSELENKPKYLLFENVDRLLISPSKQRGRDFAIILKSLDELGYIVEWRVINAAEYGFPQRRKRIFILAYLKGTDIANRILKSDILSHRWTKDIGVIAEAFPICVEDEKMNMFQLGKSIFDVSENFNKETSFTFENTGIMNDGVVLTFKSNPFYKQGEKKVLLGDILESDDKIPAEFYINDEDLKKWIYLKGSKKFERTSKDGFKYTYSEGGMTFPDKLENPSRTIITGEGGNAPSRFKHVIQTERGYRRLTPIELERLTMFPDNHTRLEGISDTKRAFFVGNALVVGIIEKLGISLYKNIKK